MRRVTAVAAFFLAGYQAVTGDLDIASAIVPRLWSAAAIAAMGVIMLWIDWRERPRKRNG
jgi:hypothetical protein